MRRRPLRSSISIVGAMLASACAMRTPPPKDGERVRQPTLIDGGEPARAIASEPPIEDAGADACVVGTREPAEDGCNTRTCFRDPRSGEHLWATTLLSREPMKILVLTLPDGTHPNLCRRVGNGDAKEWAPEPSAPYCLIVADRVDPQQPTSIAAAKARADACGGATDGIDLELVIRADGSVMKSTVVSPATKTKLTTCVADAYRAVDIRALPPRPLTLRVHHPPTPSGARRRLLAHPSANASFSATKR